MATTNPSRKRPGRPRRESNVHKVQVTIDEENYLVLKKMAEASGTNPSTYIRRVVERETSVQANRAKVPVLLWLEPWLSGLIKERALTGTVAENIVGLVAREFGGNERRRG